MLIEIATPDKYRRRKKWISIYLLGLTIIAILWIINADASIIYMILNHNINIYFFFAIFIANFFIILFFIVQLFVCYEMMYPSSIIKRFQKEFQRRKSIEQLDYILMEDRDNQEYMAFVLDRGFFHLDLRVLISKEAYDKFINSLKENKPYSKKDDNNQDYTDEQKEIEFLTRIYVEQKERMEKLLKAYVDFLNDKISLKEYLSL